MRKKGRKKMEHPIVRCPKCNSAHAILRKQWALKGGIKDVEITIKLYDCQGCGKSFRKGFPVKEGEK